MYSYDQPLMETHVLASANFGTQTAVVLPIQMGADLGDDPNIRRSPRLLNMARILGISGLVATAGAGTILIGDGTDTDRYGTITLDATVTAGNSVKATILLTEEGAHMGLADTQAASTAVTLTFSGAAVVTNLKVILGHW